MCHGMLRQRSAQQANLAGRKKDASRTTEMASGMHQARRLFTDISHTAACLPMSGHVWDLEAIDIQIGPWDEVEWKVSFL